MSYISTSKPQSRCSPDGCNENGFLATFWPNSPQPIASSLDMDVNLSGTDYIGMTIHLFAILLNEYSKLGDLHPNTLDE